MQQEIIQELLTPDRLRETLDIVDIVLGFLSSGGGKADHPLGEYIHHTLKMKRRSFSEKVLVHCFSYVKAAEFKGIAYDHKAEGAGLYSVPRFREISPKSRDISLNLGTLYSPAPSALWSYAIHLNSAALT